MKKNKMMRLASVLLVCVLLTTSVISGTFAKYVTTADASDTARVAKWGVEISTSGSLFATTYATTDDSAKGAITNSVVSSDNSKKVVAPGTKNETGIKFEIKGTPEVAFKLDIAVANSAEGSNAAKDVFLKTGTYADLTTGTSTASDTENDTFTLDADYYPIVYTLKNGKNTVLKSGKLSEIESYLENLTGNYAANTKLEEIKKDDSGTAVTDGTYVLTWAWAFEGASDEKKKAVDQADTFLGALAAGDTLAKKGTDLDESLTDGTDYCLTPDIKITITVTQID